MNEAQEVAEVVVRPGVPSDHSFVLATWLRSFRHGSPFARRLIDAVYYANHHPLATAVLARSQLLVAALPDDPNVIIGYLLVEDLDGTPTIHFAYTKKEFRRMRVLTQLLAESPFPSDLAGVEISHPTFDWLEHLAPKFPRSRLNPYTTFWSVNAAA